MTYDFAIVSSLGLSRAGVAGELDELQHGAVRVVEIGARTVDDTALPVLLEGDRDAVFAQMVERTGIVGDRKRMMHAAVVFRARVDRRLALDQDQAGAGGVEKGHPALPHRLD